MFATAALLLLLGATDPGVRAAESAYDEGNFELVLLKTDQALNRKLTLPDRKRALELRAVALIAFGRGPEAVTAFEQILEMAPRYRPSESLGPKVSAAFEEAAARKGSAEQPKSEEAVATDVPRAEKVSDPKVEAEVEEEVEDAAEEETAASGPPFALRMAPFGIGQFSRGAKDRGTLFLATEAVAFSTSAVALVMFESLKVSGGFLSAGEFRAEDGARAYTLQTVYVAAFWTGVALVIAGAVEGALWAPDAEPRTAVRF